MNPGEAMLASQLAAELLGIGVRDVLIVSPYRAQVSETANIWSASYPHSECKPRIQTVDSSQGSEADVVIVSLTRARGPPGLLRSTKRTNVMIISLSWSRPAVSPPYSASHIVYISYPALLAGLSRIQPSYTFTVPTIFFLS
ncbi:hypothetical protein C8Q69DRAFT_224171 [Paecilomyces variotii]|uniref:DNA2/NAM7 helicase-like C-terminal domain-containing protein n=1 Tax=Byssochlamys spectabilis TaxID=264951 RepID=A0A443HW04_BYSSP|nr:hypothetical protein C8Q69DRAFT_224171 [Paecilomyces variotii]RWQ95940.1 hypothetical protein C8Q69DRAFT_224171 [Paecilomyces variotii]